MNFINKIFIAGFVLMACITQTSAQKIQELEFKVYGNCEMCKERIEKALDVKGVKYASWDPETLLLKVAFRKDKITEEALHQLIIAAGNDTEKVKASDEAYQALHGCCKYRENPKCTKPE